jgi:orotate phosphoribosyltransferase
MKVIYGTELDLKKILNPMELCDVIFVDEYDQGLSHDEITHILTITDAFWMHSGDPKAPHAELTSGRCSNGFVDVLKALRYTPVCGLFASLLVKKIDVELGDSDGDDEGLFPDWVVGSDHASATLSYQVAAYFRTKHEFTEKGPGKTQVWGREKIQPDEAVLQIEELITTAGTLRAVREGLIKAHEYPLNFLPFVGCVVNRSSESHFDDGPILDLVHYDIETWEPAECPLCAQGSPRLRPKRTDHWQKLKASMK